MAGPASGLQRASMGDDFETAGPEGASAVETARLDLRFYALLAMVWGLG